MLVGGAAQMRSEVSKKKRDVIPISKKDKSRYVKAAKG